jgi:hypothetical protein
MFKQDYRIIDFIDQVWNTYINSLLVATSIRRDFEQNLYSRVLFHYLCY